MKKLKEEMSAIIERSGVMCDYPNADRFILCETGNYRCEFPAYMTEEILRRAKEQPKVSKIPLSDHSHRTQSCLVYIKDNPEFLQALYIIRDLTKQVKKDFTTYTSGQALIYAFETNLSVMRHFMHTNIGWMAYDSKGILVPIQTYLDLLPIIPKAWTTNINTF